MADKKSYQVPNLERALIIMEYLLGHPVGQTLSELAKAIKSPTNSVFRICNTLLMYGYLNRDEQSKRFTLSRKLFSLAYSSAHETSLMEKSLDVMRELRDKLHETVVISIIDKDKGLVLEQIPGLHPFRFVCDPGTSQPMHASASTKAILAFIPELQRNIIISSMEMPKLTDKTIIDRDQYRQHIKTVIQQGYAIDLDEGLDGVCCVAAPILDARQIAIAAITVTGPTTRMLPEHLEDIGHTVKEYTFRISQRMGCTAVIADEKHFA
ncbi:MAG: IclR family transcriptional regulator [Phycisphaerae bacterium]|nr:IclR family transcriptional regulator [Phycisphaerae bacterium]